MILEAIGIYAAYKLACKYNDRKDRENNKIDDLERRIKELEEERW